MKFKFILLSFSYFTLAVISAGAQTKSVKMSGFVVDGQKIDCNVRIALDIDGAVVNPETLADSFIVPPEIAGAKNINLRFTCGQYSLFFKSLKPSDFIYKDVKYEWTIGIDRSPFEEVYLHHDIAAKVKEVHYIKFYPYGYVSTILQVLIPKHPVKSRSNKSKRIKH